VKTISDWNWAEKRLRRSSGRSGNADVSLRLGAGELRDGNAPDISRRPFAFRHPDSPTYRPDHRDADRRADDPHDAQQMLGRLQNVEHRPLRGSGKRREHQSLDSEDEADRDQEFGHGRAGSRRRFSSRGYFAVVPARALSALAPSTGLPLGSTKYRKKSVSGLSSMRVSLWRNPVSYACIER